MNVFRMCLNWKVIAAVAAVAAGFYLYAPGLAAAALPFLVLAICPLSMIFMMSAMNGMGKDATADPGSGEQRSESPEEQLASLQAQQRDLAGKIAALERR